MNNHSSATITKQENKQKQVLSGFVTFGSQDASNCIAVANDANACREQALGNIMWGEYNKHRDNMGRTTVHIAVAAAAVGLF